MSESRDKCDASSCELNAGGYCDYERVNSCRRPCPPGKARHFNPAGNYGPIKKSERLELYERGLTDEEIAELQKVTASAISGWRKKYSLPVNGSAYKTRKAAAEAERLELYDRGLTDDEIAERLNVSRGSVCNWRFQRDLPANRKKRAPSTKKVDKPAKEEDKPVQEAGKTKATMTVESLLKILTNAPLGAEVCCSQCGEPFACAEISDEYGPDGERRKAIVHLGR